MARGNEEIALTETIREALLELKHPETREPIVVKFYTAQEALGPIARPDVPDIMVVFRDDLGPLDACWSDRLGLIKRTVCRMAAANRRSHPAFDVLGIEWSVPGRGAV